MTGLVGRCPVCGAIVRLRKPNNKQDLWPVYAAGKPVVGSHTPGGGRVYARTGQLPCFGGGAYPDQVPVREPPS